MIENYQQEQKLKEKNTPVFTLAQIGQKYSDGVSLIFPGSNTESQKHYKYNIDAKFGSGDLAYIVKDSGTYIAICRLNNNSGTLPDGYQKKEYIKSSGIQYINTEFIPSSNTKILMTAKINSTATNGAYFGSRMSNSSMDAYSYSLIILSNSVRSDFYGDSKTSTNFSYDIQNIEKNKNQITIFDQILTHPKVEKKSEVPLYLFCTNTNDSPLVFAKMNLYTCKIYDNDKIVRNYIPCVNPSGKAGLFDLVESKFYENKGSGEFAYE